MKKPVILRVLFILNAILMFLPFVFYYAFTKEELTSKGLEPIHMIYTGIGYIINFAIMVASILNKRIQIFRGIFLLTILISLPLKAYIGIAFGIISILLSFNSKIKLYFKN